MGISVKAELARKNIKYKRAAQVTGIPASTFYKKLDKNNFSIEEAEKVFGAIGLVLKIEERGGKNGEKEACG